MSCVSRLILDFVQWLNPSIFLCKAKALSRDRLTELFKSCGTIVNIQVRCFGGQAIAPEVGALRHTLDRQYASIHFKSPRAVKDALNKHGDECNGHKLYVSEADIQILL